MAIAKDHVSVTTANSSGGAITITSSTGNLIVVGMSNPAATVVTGVVDSKGNTYVSAGPATIFAANRVLEVWYASNAITGVTTVTPSWTGGGTSAVGIYDCSGADVNNPLSAYSQLNQAPASATPAGPTVQVNTGGGIVIAVVSGGMASAIGSPFTFDGGGLAEGFGSDVNAGSGTFQPNWTSTSAVYSAITVAFKSTAGVPLLIVQDKGNSGGTSLTVASTKLNNLLIVLLVFDGTGSVTGVTDNATGGTNTYSQCTNSLATSSVSKSSIWYAVGVRAGATTITTSSTSSIFVTGFYEVSGADTVSPFDIANHADNQTAGTTGPPYKMSNPSLTTNFAQEIIVSCEGNNAAIIAPFVDDPFLKGFSNGANASRIVIATGTYNAIWDSNTSADLYNVSIAAFKIATLVAGQQGIGAAVQDDMVWGGGDQE